MNNIIVFEEKVTTYGFYTKVLKDFYNMYRLDRLNVPILDFRNTQYICQAAVPVILCFGDYLHRLYGKKIRIIYINGSGLQNFLILSKFYEISKKLEIFEWDENILQEWEYKEIRDLHKITHTNIEYADANKIKDLRQKRDYIYDCLVDKSRVIYEEILKDVNRLPHDIIETTICAIAEVQTNAIMYSKSHSFTFVASDGYGTNISIADSGIGFKLSFENDKEKFKMVQKFQNVEQKFHNFLIIMSALNYSYKQHVEKDRQNLWTLRTNIIKNNGVFKIQYENTQVIFSCNRCSKCEKLEGEKDISQCVNCLMSSYNVDMYSPIKIFNIGFQGVRIEVKINKGKNK